MFAFIAAYLYACSPAPKAGGETPVSLPVANLQTAAITTYQQYPAAIEGVENVEIRPQVTGTLDQVLVDEGAYVTTGQPLFKINDQPFRAALNNATASLHAAEGALVNANLEVEKLSPLVQSKVVSEYQLKSAKAAADVAHANIEMAQATITNAQINLGYTLIKAPVSGYIGRLIRKKGSLVSAADPDALTVLSDVHNVHVYFSLAEKDFTRFKEQYPGETLTEKLKQLPPVSLLLDDTTHYEQQGNIDMVDGQFDKNTGSITLRANFPNPKGILRSGNTGKIELSLLHNDAIMVPQSATVEMQDKIFVFALNKDNTVRKQIIEVVGRNGQHYIVSGGLQNGDRIVTDGLGTLQEGAKVQPQSSDPTAKIK